MTTAEQTARPSLDAELTAARQKAETALAVGHVGKHSNAAPLCRKALAPQNSRKSKGTPSFLQIKKPRCEPP